MQQCGNGLYGTSHWLLVTFHALPTRLMLLLQAPELHAQLHAQMRAQQQGEEVNLSPKAFQQSGN